MNIISNISDLDTFKMLCYTCAQRWSNLSGDYNVLGDYLVTHWKKKICQLAQTEDYTQHSWREASHLKLLMRQWMFFYTQLISFLEQQTTLISQNCCCFEKIMRSWEWELSVFIKSFMWWTFYQLKHDKLSRELSCHFIFSSYKLLTRTE